MGDSPVVFHSFQVEEAADSERLREKPPPTPVTPNSSLSRLRFSRPSPGLTRLTQLINLISQLMKLIARRFVNTQGTPQKVNTGNGQDQSLRAGVLILWPEAHACLGRAISTGCL